MNQLITVLIAAAGAGSKAASELRDNRAGPDETGRTVPAIHLDHWMQGSFCGEPWYIHDDLFSKKHGRLKSPTRKSGL
jgi:hypothetical protein